MPVTRESYVAGLRAIADFYEANPDIHIPISSTAERDNITNFYCSSADDFALAARALKPFVKVYPESDKPTADMFIEREMAPGIFLRFQTRRDNICRRVTKTFPAQMIEVPERTEEVWECDESILARLSAEDILERPIRGERSLADIRDLILAGYAEMPMEMAVSAEAPRPLLTRSGADRLYAATGIRFNAGDPLPIIEEAALAADAGGDPAEA